MPTTQKETSGAWTGIARKAGHTSQYKSGFRTKTEAKNWARDRESEMAKSRGERGLGPARTPTADALRQDGLETLPFKKGAKQEANRINHVLRLADRPTLVVTPCAPEPAATATQADAKRRAQIKFFEVRVKEAGAKRRVVPSLAAHREALAAGSAASDRILKRLALMNVAEITPADLQELVNARALEGKGASTLRNDVHVFRAMINRVRKAWNWRSLKPIGEDDIKFPALPEGREVVLKPTQEEALANALQTSYHPLALKATAMLIETAMRFAECMQTALVRDIKWDEQVIRLAQGKAGGRDVPLNENAQAILRSMDLSRPDAPIFGMSYESYKNIFERACERAGIEGVQVHDLRHTAATRAAKRFGGNIFLLKALTGHKTLTQLQRYVHVGASDAVEAYQETAANTPPTAMALAAAGQQPPTGKELRALAQRRARERRAATAEPASIASSPARGASAPAAQAEAPQRQLVSPAATHAAHTATVISLAEHRGRRQIEGPAPVAG